MIGGSDKKSKFQIEPDPDKSKCEKSPAGHYREEGDDAFCVYLYDEDMKPMENVDIEMLTSDGVKVRDRETGETKTIRKS